MILSLGSAAMALVPNCGAPLAERYPALLNALVLGFTLAMGLITWGHLVGRRRRKEEDAASLLGAIMPDLQRFAFLSGALALVAAGLMAIWPLMRDIATPDDSIGRVVAGFGADLLLVLVMMICARRIKRPPFHILTFMALASTIGFMLIRMYPYTPRFG